VKVVALVSGGIDSSTLLYYLKKVVGCDVIAVSFDYGQKLVREIEHAKKICDKIGVKHYIIDISGIKPFTKSTLSRGGKPVPDVPSSLEDFSKVYKQTIVPNRNTILLSIAAGFAKSIGYDAVAYAAHWSDRGVYPDCREEFVKQLEKAFQLAVDDPNFRILRPFINLTKSSIIKIGTMLKVPFELTWSCYKGKEVHCGTCPSCRERQKAFEEAGIPDPTVYKRR